MNSINKDMFEEKKKASAELMQLGNEKENIQSHLFRVHEAQKRLNKEGLSSPTRQSSNMIHNLTVPVLLGGRPVVSSLPIYAPSVYGSSNQTSTATATSTSSSFHALNSSAVAQTNNLPNHSVDKLQEEINKLKLQSSSILAGRVQ